MLENFCQKWKVLRRIEPYIVCIATVVSVELPETSIRTVSSYVDAPDQQLESDWSHTRRAVFHQTTTSRCKPAASNSETSARLQAHRRSVRNLTMIVGVYLCLTLPYVVCSIILAANEGIQCTSNDMLELFIDWSPYVACLANPMSVILVQSDFRTAVQKLLSCKKIK